jgi:RNA polymerase sigma factor (sigma-70 family)
MEKWQTGDISDFENLYKQYEKLVLKNAYLITGQREEAEDVLQQVFISVWKSRKTFNPEKGKLSTWLHRITVNECMKKQHYKKEPITDLIENARLTEVAEDPVQSLMKKEQYDNLLKAVNHLDNKHRSILVLRYFNDLSYDDIAKTAGIPLGTVKSRINNGLRLLREKVGVKYQEVQAEQD